jgi:glyoxylase-like metal-dependent hydrolase (beta-lactamase superfamily II)
MSRRRKPMSEGFKLVQVEDNIYYIDSLRLGAHSVSGIYLIIAGGITLIEAGTTHTAPYIIEAVRLLGFEEKDVVRCINTHIHLDHSCASGWLARHMPQMQVYAHERGLKHLADPSRLLESAQMVYGDIDTIIEIHGEILPVPEKNLVPITNAELDLGSGVRLKIFEGPGHAPHHICIFEPETGCIFTGEALGHYLPEFDVITPAVAPPGFDLEASIETVNKIRALNPRAICFSQFGQRRDPEYVFEEWERQIRSYGDLIGSELKRGLGTGEITEMLFESLTKDPKTRQFSEQSLRGMLMSTVVGYYQYFQKIGEVN